MTDCVVQGYGEIVMVRLGSFVVLFSFLSDESMACFFFFFMENLRLERFCAELVIWRF